jgi:hypothetical protein
MSPGHAISVFANANRTGDDKAGALTRKGALTSSIAPNGVAPTKEPQVLACGDMDHSCGAWQVPSETASAICKNIWASGHHWPRSGGVSDQVRVTSAALSAIIWFASAPLSKQLSNVQLWRHRLRRLVVRLCRPARADHGAPLRDCYGDGRCYRADRSTPSRVRAAGPTIILGIADASPRSSAAARDGHSGVERRYRTSTNRTPMAAPDAGAARWWPAGHVKQVPVIP